MVSIRSSARFFRRSSRRGVSLIELLVVLVIMLLIFTMAGVMIGPPLRKARLASAANDLTVLAQRAVVEARKQRGGQGLFIYLKGTPGTRVFELIADTGGGGGGDGIFQDPISGAVPDSVLTSVQAVRLPPGIVFYNMDAPWGNSWTNWAASGSDYVLGLDFQGRTVGPGDPGPPAVPGRQIAGFASVNLTHADMASGAITPLIVHRVTIGAVWGVRHTRLVQDSAAPTPGPFEAPRPPGWREF